MNFIIKFRRLFYTFFCAYLFSVSPVGAYKVDAHIWIAQQVLDEARTGSVQISLGGKSRRYQILPRYARAVRAHPEAFLLGSVGPDAFPSVMVGQLVIHPGFKNGWGAADWLRHLLSSDDLSKTSDRDLAFILGYFTHVASDIFAHTYVNRYAGGVFNISENDWVAVRHVYIESMISRYLPQMRNVKSKLTRPYLAIRDKEGQLPVPKQLLYNRFFENAKGLSQLRRSGKVPHLVSVYDLKLELDRLLVEDGPLQKLEQKVGKLIFEYYTGLPISEADVRKIQEVAHAIDGSISTIAIKTYLKWIHEYNNALADTHQVSREIINKAFAEVQPLHSELLSVQSELEDIAIQVADESLKLLGTPKSVKKYTKRKCVHFFSKSWCGDVPDPVGHWVENELHSQLEKALDKLKELQKSKQDREEQLFADSKEAVLKAMDTVQSILETNRTVSANAIDFLKTQQNGSGLYKLFDNWRRSIPISLQEYFVANGEALAVSISPDGSPLSPLKDWLLCYGAAIGGIQVELTEGICNIADGVDSALENFSELEEAVAKFVPFGNTAISLKKDIKTDIAELKSKLVSSAIEESLKEFDRIANMNTEHLMKGLTEPFADGKLNEKLSVDKTNSGLLVMQDGEARIKKEMNIGASGRLDPNSFHPFYNSVVLSKLALLDTSELNRLARHSGVKKSVFGNNLFEPGSSKFSGNILYGFARNIDGNHNWHELAPPHPNTATKSGTNRQDFERRTDRLHLRYGYSDRHPSCPPTAGMRFWVDPVAREKLFKRVFRGKITAGVDAPHEFEPPFASVLPEEYPTLFLADSKWSIDGVEISAKNHGAVLPKSIQFIGQGEVGDLVELYAGDELVARSIVNQSGNWKIVLSSNGLEFGANITAEISKKDTELVKNKYFMRLGCDSIIEPNMPQIFSHIIVVEGDSLWALSEKHLGHGYNYEVLFKRNKNKIRYPHLIYPGQILRINEY